MEPTFRNGKLIAILEEVLRKSDVDWEIIYLPSSDAHVLKLNGELAFII